MHSINILIHIIAGSLALICGAIALSTRKGGRAHSLAGKIFLSCLAVVVLTGFLGVFIFKRNQFLLVITVLSTYSGFSGYRAIRLKGIRPKWYDDLAAVTALVSVMYFLWYFKRIGMFWAPVVIYTTVGYLLLLVFYDFSRHIFRFKNRLYEHIVKMISAWSGLLSAFSGTVLPNFKPYSQLLPSVFSTLLIIAFIVAVAGRQKEQDRRPEQP